MGTVTLWWPLKSSEFDATPRSDITRGLAGFSFSFGGLFSGKVAKEPDRIGAQGASNGDELNNIDTALATFILGYEGLGSSELLGQSVLANAGVFPHCDK